MPLDQTTTSLTATLPLTQAAAGTQVRIVAVEGGGGLERRLTELGLHRGAEVAVIGRMGRKGAVIVAAHGTRLVVGADMAEAISVAPVRT